MVSMLPYDGQTYYVISQYTKDNEPRNGMRVTKYDKSSHEELKEIMRAGHVFDHEDVYIGNNNWFAIQFRDGTEWDPNDDVVDVEGLSKQEIFSLMWDALSSHLEHQRPKEEALAAKVLTDFVNYLREWAITDDDRKFAKEVDFAATRFIEQTK